MHKQSTDGYKDSSIELKKPRNELGIPSSHNPVKVTPSDINTDIADVPRISHLSSIAPNFSNSTELQKVSTCIHLNYIIG